MSKHKVIGIDLGTTYSAVAAFDAFADSAEIIKNREDGDQATTPSVVGLDPASRRVVVGWPAKRNLPNDPRNTVIEVKREMGELFESEAALDKFGARGTYRLEEPVRVRLADQWLLPQEVSAFTLMRMKEIAEGEIGEEIRDAVVTVPAYFTSNQKKATEEAALLAGLYPRQLIPEPTAAAICYGVDRLDPVLRRYLVYDLGGGTFDVSIIEVLEEKIDVIATHGDARLGGGDFDDAIVRWAVQELQKQGFHVPNDPALLARIKHQAEEVKIRLSTFESTDLTLLGEWPQRPPVLTLTRTAFERLIDGFLAGALTVVEEALKKAAAKGVTREQIDGILLVGGSTNIPRVKQQLLDYFGKPTDFVRADADPAALVARGAAILARRFAPSPPPFDIKAQPGAGLVNPDLEGHTPVGLITEHSLGVGVQENIVDRLIEQGTNLPISITKDGYDNPGPVPEVEVRIYQGEHRLAYDNTLIGMMVLGPMEPREKGFHKFEVTFTLDVNGLLSVSVKHLNTGQVYQAKFEHETSVKGVEALAALRAKLVRLYQPVSLRAPAAPAAAPSGETTTYVPPPPVASAAPSATPAPVPPPPAPVPPTPDPSATEQGIPGLTPLSREAPEAQRSILRRAQKELLKSRDAKLFDALQALIEGINAGRPTDELEELQDELEDAYHDARG